MSVDAGGCTIAGAACLFPGGCKERQQLHPTMFSDDIYFILLKCTAVGLLLGAVANRMKQRSFLGWAAIGASAAAIFPGLSLVALMVLALLPKGQRKEKEK
ncbi:MAG TPA: hypothetical protein VEC35_20570 [Noviherbaspirillum sp.]|nr:hypothetical protein [Noviherbaspirillum sp.]